MDSFVLFDIEMANSEPNSICEIGVALFENGVLTSTFESLVRPQPFDITFSFTDDEADDDEDLYKVQLSPMAQMIHQIDESELINAPTLQEVWGEIETLIKGMPLVAHNASQDINKLIATLEEFDLTLPNLDYYCTLTISRNHILTKKLTSHGLEELCNDLGIDLSRKLRSNGSYGHGALEDAVATGELMIRLLSEHGGSFELMSKELDMKKGSVVNGRRTKGNTKKVVSTGNPYWATYTPQEYQELCKQVLERGISAGQSHPLFNKTVAISLFLESMTTKEFWFCMAVCGAQMKTNVSKKLQILVEGDDPTGKYQKGKTGKSIEARELNQSGLAHIDIMEEQRLLEIIGDQVIGYMEDERSAESEK
ncbi:MAG: hypothetical protein EBZ61_01120 [Micrococcales bacterium]|nr:hypothetical protein [Micrococcales bacterium]